MWSTGKKEEETIWEYLFINDGQHIFLEDKMLEKTQYKATLIFVLSLGKMP